MSDITGVVAGMAHMRIEIGPDDPHVTTWGEFCVDNSEDLEMLWECRHSLVEQGAYSGGGGAAAMFTVTRISTAQAMDRLVELADGWRVTLTHDGTDWTLILRAKKGVPAGPYVYTSTDLSRVINHAWAGAPGGRV